jgi:hypothetical protein
MPFKEVYSSFIRIHLSVAIIVYLTITLENLVEYYTSITMAILFFKILKLLRIMPYMGALSIKSILKKRAYVINCGLMEISSIFLDITKQIL